VQTSIGLVPYSAIPNWCLLFNGVPVVCNVLFCWYEGHWTCHLADLHGGSDHWVGSLDPSGVNTCMGIANLYLHVPFPDFVLKRGNGPPAHSINLHRYSTLALPIKHCWPSYLELMSAHSKMYAYVAFGLKYS